MTLLDTSLLIDALTGPKRSAAALRGAIQEGERIVLPSLVLYEWLRGPRLPQELAAQESLFPSEGAIPFRWQESALSAGMKLVVAMGLRTANRLAASMASQQQPQQLQMKAT